MNPISQQHAEVARIRAAYKRRNQTVPQDRYSFLKEENLQLHVELLQGILRFLRRFHHTDLHQEKVLDVGCGKGFWLRQLIQWGAAPENLFGIDLLEERIEEGKSLCPQGVTLRKGDASQLEFDDCTFNLVLQFTVFTSILDMEMKKRVAAEMCRVLRPGGAVLWYDYFVSNPRNPDVRGVKRGEIFQLFPDLRICLEKITLAPPIARTLGSVSPGVYRLLSAFRPLRTHYLGLFQKR